MNYTRETIEFGSKDEWLGLRGKDVTSTQSAALFGLSPYMTKFELYHEKKNGIKKEFKVTDRMEKGDRLEAAIAAEIALQEGFSDLKPFKTYMRIPELRLGSSFDFEAIDKNGKPILIEIKGVDYFQYKEKWTEDEAPAHIEIQTQHEMLASGRFDRACIVACTGIWDYHPIYRDRDTDVENAIVKATRQFWHEVSSGIEPPVDYARDQAVIDAMFPGCKDEPEDWTGDEEMESLLRRYDIAGMQEKEFKKQKDAIKAEIHHKLGDAKAAFTDRYKVTAGRTKDGKDRVAEPGEVIKGRKGYRQCLVKEIGG